jgi:hypothetical protein
LGFADDHWWLSFESHVIIFRADMGAFLSVPFLRPAIKQSCNRSWGDAIGLTECAGKGTYGRETTCAEHPDWKGVTQCCIVGKSKSLLKESHLGCIDAKTADGFV